MMASDRPAPESLPDLPIPLPPIQAPSVATEPNRLKPSPFLNGLDIFQAGGVVLLAFLLASFAVRNTDFFQHLATGRLIAEGNYSFGTDPFSYTTQGQTWVNHAWVYDWTVFQLYVRFGGAAVVIFKALLIAGLAAVLLLSRKSSHNLWFAVVGVGLGVLAMAPRLVMQPTILSFFYFGLTLLLITHWSRPSDRKRLSIAIGVLFALWSNCDQWFFFGPLTLLLFVLGELIPFRLGGPSSENRFDVKTIATALGVGVLACMVNPHHVNVWQLPEIFNSQAAELVTGDTELSTQFRGLLAQDADKTPIFFDLTGKSRIANPANSFALLFLFLFSVVGFAVNATRIRWSHLLLFVTFAVLAMGRFRLVPFFVIVAVVVSNWNFGEFVSRFTSRPIAPSLVGLIGFPRALARTLTLFVGLGLLVAVRPGALNQEPRDPLRARWLAWEVERDEALIPACETLQQWRDENRLPANARALVLHTDMVHYLNWFAPDEKTFADYRLNIHEDHLADFAFLRVWLRGRLEAKDVSKVPQLLEKYGITHLILGSADRSTNSQQAASLMTAGDPLRSGWTLWNLQGRVWVIGWDGQKSIPALQNDRLAYDVTKSVFAPDYPKLDEPREVEPYGAPGWIEAYWDQPKRTPWQIDESYSFWAYQQILRQQANNRVQVGVALSGPIAGPAAPWILSRVDAPLNRDSVYASVLRSIRRARQATLDNPDSPEAFMMLARSYDARFPTLTEFAEPMTIANSQRALMRGRLSSTSESGRAELFEASRHLGERYRRHPQGPRLDLLVPLIRSMEQFREFRMSPTTSDDREAILQWMKRPFGAKEEGPTPQEALDRIQNQFELAITGLDDDPLTRAMIARLMNLNSEAYEMLTRIETGDGEAANGEIRAVIELDAAEMGLATGNVEDAYKRIKEIEKRFGDRMNDPAFLRSYQFIRSEMVKKIQPRLQAQIRLDSDIRQTLRELKVRVCFVLGKFSEVIQEDQLLLQDLERNYEGKIAPDFVARYRKAPEPQLLQDLDLFTRFLYEPTWLHLMGKDVMNRARAEGVNQLLTEGQVLETIHFLHVRVGLMNLEKGDNVEARFHFEQALKPLGIDYPGQTSGMAREYLRLLNAAK